MTQESQKRALLVTHNDIYGLLLLNHVAPVLKARGFAIEICISRTSEKGAERWAQSSSTMAMYRQFKDTAFSRKDGDREMYLGQVMRMVDEAAPNGTPGERGNLLTFKAVAREYTGSGKYTVIGGGEIGGNKFHDSGIVQGHLKGKGDIFLSLDPTTKFDGRTVDYLETNGIARMGIHPGMMPFFKGLHNTIASLLEGRRPCVTVFRFGKQLDDSSDVSVGIYRVRPNILPGGSTAMQHQATQYFNGATVALEILGDVISGAIQHRQTQQSASEHRGAATEAEVLALKQRGIEVYNLGSFVALMNALLPPSMGIERLPKPDFVEQRDFDVAVAAVSANAPQTRWVGEMVDGITKAKAGRGR